MPDMKDKVEKIKQSAVEPDGVNWPAVIICGVGVTYAKISIATTAPKTLNKFIQNDVNREGG
jgi:hypothetical protein